MKILDYHTKMMKLALNEAHKGLQRNEVPIGALVVKNGAIQGRGYNLVEAQHQQIAHAEVRAISQACRRIQDWRLEGCWIYVTLEPCSMCISLIMLSRCKGLVYGAASPKFGYRLANASAVELKRLKIEVISGICQEESALLLKEFFKGKRI
jgi:tRNA(adenine34) deaminase